jgi:hypothetical protein
VKNDSPATGVFVAVRPEDILTPEEVAKRLKVPPTWVYEKTRSRGQRNKNPLPCLRIGKYIRFAWPQVAAWLESTTSVRKVART